MHPIYLTRGDILLLDIMSADILPSGDIYICFTHVRHGLLFAAQLRFQVYERKTDKWSASVVIYPDEDVVLNPKLRELIKEDLIQIFGPIMKDLMGY
jgi:hypothetical protein